MRAILNAVLSFGLMNVPVGVATAAKRKSPEFRTLHKKCGAPISAQRVCTACQADNLLPEEMTPGFEFTKGHFVVLDESELDSIKAERSNIITIQKFVPWDNVDELQVEKSYYLNPNAALSRPYTLLANAIGNKGAVGIGGSSLWGKETPSMVWAKESGALVLSMLYCYDETVSDIEIVERMGLVSEEEQGLADQLVAYMMRDLDPATDFVSESRRRVDEYISMKVSGQEFEVVEPVEALEPTVDILAGLRESIELARSAS